LGDRRETRGLNPRVRVAVRALRRKSEIPKAELVRLVESVDLSRRTIERLTTLFAQVEEASVGAYPNQRANKRPRASPPSARSKVFNRWLQEPGGDTEHSFT
jgi:hypothetical protein